MTLFFITFSYSYSAGCLSAPKSVTKQVTVHDAADAEQTEQPPGAEIIRVQSEDSITGHTGFII